MKIFSSPFGKKDNKNEKLIDIKNYAKLLLEKYPMKSDLEEKVYKPIDLINLYIEFSLMTSQVEREKKLFINNPPRFIRYSHLYSLNKAFLDNDETDFYLKLQNGDFIEKRAIEVYEPLFNHIVEKYPHLLSKHKLEIARLSWPDIILDLYRNLLRFKIETHKYIHFNNVTEYFSIVTRYQLDLVDSVVKNLDKEKLDEVDWVLSTLISPSNKTIPVTELIMKYGFLNVDLQEIDSDHY